MYRLVRSQSPTNASAKAVGHDPCDGHRYSTETRNNILWNSHARVLRFATIYRRGRFTRLVYSLGPKMQTVDGYIVAYDRESPIDLSQSFVRNHFFFFLQTHINTPPPTHHKIYLSVRLSLTLYVQS